MGVFRQSQYMLFPRGRKYLHPDWPAVVITLIIPVCCAVATFMFKAQIGNADIIVSGAGVLGGLLFAHAIFVFQLRMAYADAKRRRSDGLTQHPMEKLSVSEMIDQMFYSVVYASALSLLITLGIGLSASFGLSNADKPFPLWFSTLAIFFISHLAGWVWYVISITVSAYRDLIKEL